MRSVKCFQNFKPRFAIFKASECLHYINAVGSFKLKYFNSAIFLTWYIFFKCYCNYLETIWDLATNFDFCNTKLTFNEMVITHKC